MLDQLPWHWYSYLMAIFWKKLDTNLWTVIPKCTVWGSTLRGATIPNGQLSVLRSDSDDQRYLSDGHISSRFTATCLTVNTAMAYYYLSDGRHYNGLLLPVWRSTLQWLTATCLTVNNPTMAYCYLSDGQQHYNGLRLPVWRSTTLQGFLLPTCLMASSWRNLR